MNKKLLIKSAEFFQCRSYINICLNNPDRFKGSWNNLIWIELTGKFLTDWKAFAIFSFERNFETSRTGSENWIHICIIRSEIDWWYYSCDFSCFLKNIFRVQNAYQWLVWDENFVMKTDKRHLSPHLQIFFSSKRLKLPIDPKIFRSCHESSNFSWENMKKFVVLCQFECLHLRYIFCLETDWRRNIEWHRTTF